MLYEELREELYQYEEVHEDILIDDVQVEFLEVRGDFDNGYNSAVGAFFFELNDGLFCLPFKDGIDGDENYRPTAAPEGLRKADEKAVDFLTRQISQQNKESEKVKEMVIAYERDLSIYEKDKWKISVEQLLEWKALLRSANDKDVDTVAGQIEDILNQLRK